MVYPNCFFSLNDCAKICSPLYFNCHVVTSQCVDGGIVANGDGSIDVDCSTCNKGPGRTPSGLAPAAVSASDSPLGRHFAHAAYFEAASVVAFRRLERDLDDHGAPRWLGRAARRAARDEVRHAAVARHFARRFGGCVGRVRVAPIAKRALVDIAIENAVEGCVHETFEAVLAAYQAQHARDAQVARALGQIARDESQHAALAWSVAAWLETRLTPSARRRVRVARDRALAALLRGRRPTELSAEERTISGVPSVEVLAALLQAFPVGFRELFA